MPYGPNGPIGASTLSDTAALKFGTAAAGTSEEASRADHVHPARSAGEIQAYDSASYTTRITTLYDGSSFHPALRFTTSGNRYWIFKTTNGTPEGVITADPGSLCTTPDGGAGTTLYVKETGTGNTGWAAV